LSEQQSQFSLWAIFAAPLFVSSNLRTIPTESREILLNQEIIAVNQDVLGRQGWCAEEKPLWRVWVRELHPSQFASSRTHPPLGTSDRWAVVLENRQTIFYGRNITFEPKRHLPSASFGWNEFKVRDLVHHGDLGVFSDTFSTVVDESSVATFLVQRVDNTYDTDISRTT
jgi:Alpha galactosidase A